jgi:hypothetical protein
VSTGNNTVNPTYIGSNLATPLDSKAMICLELIDRRLPANSVEKLVSKRSAALRSQSVEQLFQGQFVFF